MNPVQLHPPDLSVIDLQIREGCRCEHWWARYEVVATYDGGSELIARHCLTAWGARRSHARLERALVELQGADTV